MPDEFFHVKRILRIGVSQFLVTFVLCNIEFVRIKRLNAAQLQDSLVAVHDGKLVAAHKLLPSLLVI